MTKPKAKAMKPMKPMEPVGVANYTTHSRLAEGLGLTELKVKLEEMAADESHARELNRILKGL